MPRGFADTSFGQIHYLDSGSGEPLVLLHQTADSGLLFTEITPFLSDRFRVIAIDTPGFGESDHPKEPIGIPGFALSVAETLDYLGVERANLLGHHTGASIAVEFAANWPNRVIKLILSGCPDLTAETRKERLSIRKPWIIYPDGSHLTETWKGLSTGYMKNAMSLDQINREVVDMLKAGPTQTYWGYLAVLGHDVRTRVGEITAPTLVTSGEFDRAGANQDDLARQFKDARTHVSNGAGSAAMIELPDEYARMILEFLCRD